MAEVPQQSWKVLDSEVGRWAPVEPLAPSGVPLARRSWYAWAWAVLDVSDWLVLLGVLLLARGWYLVHPALGWIVSGTIVLWCALPPRPKFFSSPSAPRDLSGEQGKR